MDVRKNAATLSPEEWRRLNTAFVALKHTYPPGSNVSVYDHFVAVHVGVTILATGPQAGIDGGHRGPAFLPWHREYLRRLEKALQTVDASVTLPYWNWGLGPTTDTTSLFQDATMGPSGSGGASGFDVMSGYWAHTPNAFNTLGWEIHPDLRRFGAALQRNTAFNASALPTAIQVSNTLALTSYDQFRPSLEQTLHNPLHGWVGRDMGQMTSPNDPIFWLHHTQVDHIWAIWQRTHPGSANYNPLGIGGAGHRLHDPMWPWDGGLSNIVPGNPIAPLLSNYANIDVATPAEVINHRDLGYCYDDEEDCPCADRITTVPSIPRLEDIPTLWQGEEPPTTFLRGEEDPTTLLLGEEGPPPPTTFRRGEEVPTTLRLGEEGPSTTFIRGEEEIDIPRGNPFGDF